MTRAITLADLHELCDRWVPLVARHEASLTEVDHETWWFAHEIGHMLTVEPSACSLPMFGLSADLPTSTDVACELAAMSVSRRLLTAVGHERLYRIEVAVTPEYVLDTGQPWRVRRILAWRRLTRMPTRPTREWLETKLIQAARGTST